MVSNSTQGDSAAAEPPNLAWQHARGSRGHTHPYPKGRAPALPNFSYPRSPCSSNCSWNC